MRRPAIFLYGLVLTESNFKAKPARNVVKIQPLKALKDMV